MTSTLLANVLGALSLDLTSTPSLSPAAPLPMTLNQLTVEFKAAAPERFGVELQHRDVTVIEPEPAG